MKGEIVQLDWTDDNVIDLLQNGADFFPALCGAIDGARLSVHLETYIFVLDRTGEVVMQSLERAARRGVKVRVVLDGFGCADAAEALQDRLRVAGAHCRIFRPEPPWHRRLMPSRSRLRRLHRKMTVIDGEVAFVGGINVVDDYDDLEPHDGIATPRFDFAVRVKGALVARAVYAQDLLWVRLNWARLRRHPRDWAQFRLGVPSKKPAVASPGTRRAALVLRDNVRFRQTFERAYLYGIEHARHDILIANAYFFPGGKFRRALLNAVARGVRVRLLLQGKVEYHLQYHATRSLYGQLLRGGVEIYEYMPGYLHAKVAVIDDVAKVGSSNLDPFSLLLAREANVVVDDASFAQELRQRLEAAIHEGGRLVGRPDYDKRGWASRSVDAMAYKLLRIGVALTGRAQDY